MQDSIWKRWFGNGTKGTPGPNTHGQPSQTAQDARAAHAAGVKAEEDRRRAQQAARDKKR